MLPIVPDAFLITAEPLVDKWARGIGRRVKANSVQDSYEPLSRHHQRGIILPIAVSPTSNPQGESKTFYVGGAQAAHRCLTSLTRPSLGTGAAKCASPHGKYESLVPSRPSWDSRVTSVHVLVAASPLTPDETEYDIVPNQSSVPDKICRAACVHEGARAALCVDHIAGEPPRAHPQASRDGEDRRAGNGPSGRPLRRQRHRPKGVCV